MMPGSVPQVVVTGLGLWTGLGADRETTWTALRAGRTAAREAFGTVGFPFARDVRRPAPDTDEPVLMLLERVAAEALEDAGLVAGLKGNALPVDPERVATLIGLSKGCVRGLGRLAEASTPSDWLAGGGRFGCWPNAGARMIAALHDLRGPCLAPIAACATGLVAAIQGAELIRRGVCDLALVGAADASLEPFPLAAFHKMKVLARPGGDPARMVRPWDKGRSGFLVGEGGAVLVLERAEQARSRGALPYAEFAGGALGADAFHATNLNPDPTGLSELIGRALRNAGVGPSEIDHVNVHGTATRANDPLECRALRRALGGQADRVACSANKAQIGHLLGAAGAVELAITCLAVRDGFAPPTLNLDDPDPACDLDGTPHVGRSLPIRAALKLSIGFGGHFAAAVLRRFEGATDG